MRIYLKLKIIALNLYLRYPNKDIDKITQNREELSIFNFWELIFTLDIQFFLCKVSQLTRIYRLCRQDRNLSNNITQ